MSYTVYALYSIEADLFYIGQTKDMNRRFSEHQKGESRFTSRSVDWKIIYLEECETRSYAVRREKQLKSFRGREYLRSLL